MRGLLDILVALFHPIHPDPAQLEAVSKMLMERNKQ